MILIIDKSKKDATVNVDILNYMGVLSHGVTPEMAFSEISCKYRAVLAVMPESFPELRYYAKKLRVYAAGTPIFALTANAAMAENYFDGVYNPHSTAALVVSQIADFCKKKNLPVVGSYTLGGINATADLKDIYFFDEKITLTKTEKMILRYLIRSYPTPARATEILKYAYRPGRMPLPSSIRTHISQINRKFCEHFNYTIISNIDEKGYAIMTPLLKKSIKEAVLMKNI